MGLARPGLVRNAAGSLAILAIVAFLVLGLPWIDRSMPASRPVAAGVPVRVSDSVSIRPPAGASIDLTRTRPAADHGTVVFNLDGGVRLSVVVSTYRGGLAGAAGRLRGKIHNTSGYRVMGREKAVVGADGVAGRQGSYRSSGRRGTYVVYVRDNLAIELTASGPTSRLRSDRWILQETFVRGLSR